MRRLSIALALCFCLVASTALAGAPLAPHAVKDGPDFISEKTSTAEIAVQRHTGGQTTTVTWSIVAVDNSANPAVVPGHRNKATGLAWGKDAPDNFLSEVAGTAASQTDASGIARIQLTDIVGERTVTVQASVTIDGTTYTTDQRVSFGKGPLSVFRARLEGELLWAKHSPISNEGNAQSGDFPAAHACGAVLSAAELRNLPDGYHAATGLPSPEQLKAVGTFGNGARIAAGWPEDGYWTGELRDNGSKAVTVWSSSSTLTTSVHERAFPVVCLR